MKPSKKIRPQSRSVMVNSFGSTTRYRYCSILCHYYRCYFIPDASDILDKKYTFISGNE